MIDYRIVISQRQYDQLLQSLLVDGDDEEHARERLGHAVVVWGQPLVTEPDVRQDAPQYALRPTDTKEIR